MFVAQFWFNATGLSSGFYQQNWNLLDPSKDLLAKGTNVNQVTCATKGHP